LSATKQVLEEQKEIEREFSDEEPAKGKNVVVEPVIDSKEEQDYQLVCLIYYVFESLTF
jgi:hypothetical protein